MVKKRTNPHLNLPVLIDKPITPSQEPTLIISEDKKLQSAYEKVKKQYDSTLRKLAE